MSMSLTVGGVTAAPGQLASGWIEVPEGVDAGTRIPVTVANGAAPGSVLALVAGTHGSEYTSILALQRLRPRLEPARMRGAAILVHMANPPAFYGRRVYYGPDGKNLNRVYPGRPDGTVSDRIAHAITREVIDRCTHLADMHCGDGNESLRPYTYWIVGGEARVDEASRELALAYGLDHILVDRGRPRDASASLFTANTAITRGKPAITTESGGAGQTDEPSVAAHEAGARSLLAHLGILEGPSTRVPHPVWIDRAEVLRSPVAGIWHPVVEKMQSVAAGRLLGRVTDPFGAVLHEARAPFAGEVVYVVATPPVNAGEPLCEIGQLAETPGVA
jgi:predicted deacylase